MRPDKAKALGMVLKGYPRISETFISNEILLLERMGFSIHIFSMRHPREPFSHQSVKQIQARADYLPQTLIRPLPVFLYYNIPLFIQKPKTYLGALKTAFRRFCRTRKSATFKHLLQAGYLVKKLLPQAHVDHFHAHFAHSPTSVAMFAAQLAETEFSFTGHAKDVYTQDRRQLKEKIHLARFVITCTEYNRRYLKQVAGTGQTPIYRVYHGIDLGLFAWDNQVNERPSAPYQLLTVARIAPKKGLPTVYQALKILKDQGLDFQHRLIGDGEDREKILALIKTLGLADQCQWLGTLAHEEVLDHYRSSDLFVLGCQIEPNGDRDGIPNVLVEAMAVGLPVVATDISAIPELVDSETSGLLVPSKSPEALAKAMQRLLSDSALRAQVIPKAREKVAAAFDNQRLIRDLAAIYQEQGIG